MDGKKSEKFGPMIYTQKIYILSIALYIYVYIYIEKLQFHGEAMKVVCVGRGWKQEISVEGVASLAPTQESPGRLKPLPHSMGPWAAFHILGRGDRSRERRGGGWVSKLCCNLRKVLGSVGSGKPSWGGKAPHLGGEGRG